MDCDTCKKERAQGEAVPRWTHEADMARMERNNKRLWVLLIIVLALLFGTNAGWIYYESQFTDEVVTQDVETGEGDAIISGIGDIHYGESSTDG